MRKYRWDSPHDWLSSATQSDDPVYLRGLLSSLLTELDADTIQDVFEPDMVSAGYFREIEPPALIKKEGEEFAFHADSNDADGRADTYYDSLDDAVREEGGEWEDPTDEDLADYGTDVVKIRRWEG